MFPLCHQLLRHIGLFVFMFHFYDALPSYYIAKPSYIYPGVNTTLAVHWLGNYSEINVTAGILAGNIYVVHASDVFQNDSIGTLSIPPLPMNTSLDNIYYMFINGSAGDHLVFSDTFDVTFGKQILSLIETDKTIYSPKETVKIRVIVVHHTLKPYKGPVNITIQDPYYNTVHQWLNREANLGTVTAEFLLPPNAHFGSWNIAVIIDQVNYSENSTYSFLVQKRDSAKFYVGLVAPSYYYKPNKLNFTGTVFANNTYGIPIKGNVTLFLKYDPNNNVSGIVKTYTISGSLNFSFSYDEILKDLLWQRLILTASVTAENTGLTETASWYVQSATSEYRIIMVQQPDIFKTGFNFTTKIQILRTDDLPFSEEERNDDVVFTAMEDSAGFTLQKTIPESGVITIEFPLLNPTILMTIKAAYKNSVQTWSMHRTYGWSWYDAEPFVYISIPDTQIQVGTPLPIQLTTKPDAEYCYFVVMARGVIVATGKTNNSSFTLIPENSWTPTATLSVYILNSADRYHTIISASEKLNIKGMFKNKVSLSWRKNKAEPSENVSLTISNIQETPSVVGLRVVDINDKSMGDGNDLTAKVKNAILDQDYFTNVTDFTVRYFHKSIISIFNAIGGNNDPIKQPVNVRPFIPETWIWLQTNASSEMNTSIQVTVPNKMISWTASAFVLSEEMGLGVTEETAELEIFQPLHLSLNAPDSVTRGEQFILKISLESYITKNLQITVTLELSDLFDIIIPDDNLNAVAWKRNVYIPSQTTKLVLFPIYPKKLGEMSLIVNAKSSEISNSATKKVFIKAEGIQIFYSQNVIVEAPTSMPKLVSFIFPSDIVPDSEQISVEVAGNILAPSIKGLQSLIQFPTGCGEQNMIDFAPNIYVLQYLIATNQITEDFRAKAIGFMERGYNTELMYRRFDGSFSAFGNKDDSGSTWLSAFVLQCFLQAHHFISVHEDILDSISEWLLDNQNKSTGIFLEPGQIINPRLQGGSSGVITRTAYILISLLQNERSMHLYAPRIDKTIQYLENKTEEGITSNHTLSVVAYALSVANSSKAAAALTQLNSRANSTGGQMYWSTSNYWQPPSADIETAAYALLSHYQQKRIAEGVLIMNWLSQHRNHLGGYSSTQDTVMALHALTKFMTLVPSSNSTLNVSVTAPGSFASKTFQITNENLLVVQSQRIDAYQPLEFNVSAVGKGVAIFQLKIIYNQKAPSRYERDISPRAEVFKLTETLDEKDVFKRISVNVCSSYQGPDDKSGMVLLDLHLLSGYELDPLGITLNEPLKLVETKDDKVFLYFNSMKRNETCVTVPMVRTAMVAGHQAAVVNIYDYYNPGDFATSIYNSDTLRKIEICDYCGLNCSQCKSNVIMSMTSSVTTQSSIPQTSSVTSATVNPHTSSIHKTTTKPSVSTATVPTLAMFWFCVIGIWYIF